MPSRSPSRSDSRGRSRTRTPPSEPRRSITPRAESRSRSRSPRRSPSPRDRENGFRTVNPHTQHRSQSPRPRSPAERSSKLVVEKLTKNVNEGHLREIFGAYGSLRDVELPMNRQFMTNRGTAYVLFANVADAETAIAHMHEAQLDGAVISVSIVLPRRKFSRSPPPSRRLTSHLERIDNRGRPGGFRAPIPPMSGSRPFRSSPMARRGSPPPGRRGSPPPGRGRSPPRRGYRADNGWERNGYDRNRPYSRSRSPRYSRSRSYSSRSRSRSPPRRQRAPPELGRGDRGGHSGGMPGNYRRRDSPPRGERSRRSPSYSSYSSRSRSRSKSRDRGGHWRR